MRTWQSRALAALLLALPLFAHAVPVRVLAGEDRTVTRRIVEDLERRLAPLQAGGGTRTLCITVGPVALHEAIERQPFCALLSIYTSSQVWRAAVSELPAARARNMTAIYAEPAPAEQLRLISLLYRKPVKVAAIVGVDTAFLKPVLAGSADVEMFWPGDDINFMLNRIGQAEVLLATPDSSVYNPENIRNILLSTYRHNQGVIGFSADMVQAGALASTYSSIGDVNAQAVEIAAAYLATGELPVPAFPRYFSTVINDGVAHSLGVEPDRAARNFGRRPPGAPK
jgi:hypothetical protein